MSISILILLLLVLILLRVPVGFALLVPSLLYIVFDPQATFGIAIQQLMNGGNSFALLAIPMFVLLGNLANASGITDRMYDFASASLRGVRGGLAYVNVGTSVGFSLVSGAAISDAAAMGKIQVPQMVKRGYPAGFSLGLTGASSLIAPMVPPSIPAVVYAITAGVSVSSLFVAGIFPALVITLLFIAYVALKMRKLTTVQEGDEKGVGAKRLWILFLRTLPAVGAPVIVLGGILAGYFTPTEASAAGVVYVLVLGLIYRGLNPKALLGALRTSTATSASIMFIVVNAALFGWVLARERVPQELAESVLGLTENPFVFLILLNLVLLAIGAIIEPTSAILILVPVLAPLAPLFGLDPIHMGIVIIFNLMIGLLTPPIGLVLFTLSEVTGYPVKTVIRGAVPFYGIMLVALAAISFVPLMLGIG
ncbi:TRAP transporter large permease [Nesterenkonia flava]|uniref:TRAP transporter large permease n=1 Tax=Nesterenkonia flava TaxID=469799 RepID=A0ABU1FY37_9MICC|nr:TRAP transporter large permease [Nesterenkonia flava]MDR5713073.1 TRAP transporter large permease [Nesterenkonia flava]